jgi:hypothetical protein
MSRAELPPEVLGSGPGISRGRGRGVPATLVGGRPAAERAGERGKGDLMTNQVPAPPGEAARRPAADTIYAAAVDPQSDHVYGRYLLMVARAARGRAISA